MGILILSVVGCLYLGFITNWFHYDGIRWSLRVESTDLRHVFDSHHLLSSFLAPTSYRFARFLGYEGRALHFLPVMNSIIGILGLAAFYFLALRVTRDKIASVVTTLGLGFSYGYWFASVSALADIVTFVSLVVGFHVVLRFIDNDSMGSWVSLGLLGGFLWFVEVGAFLFFPAIFLAVYFHAREFSLDARKLATCGIACLGIGVIPYVVIGIYVNEASSIEQIVLLVTRGCEPWGEEQIWWDFHLGNIPKFLCSVFRAFVGVSFIKELFLSDFGFSDLFILGCLTLFVLVAFLVAIYGLSSFKDIRNDYGRPAALSILYVLSCAVFFTVHGAGGTRLPPRIVPFIWLLFAATIAVLKGRSKGSVKKWLLPASFSMPALLLCTNFFGSILPQSFAENNENLQYSNFIGDNTNKTDLVLFSGRGGLSDGVLLAYFSGNQTLSFAEALRAPTILDSRIKKAVESGAQVYFVSDEKSASFQTVIGLLGLPVGKHDSFSGGRIQAFFSDHGYELSAAFQFDDKHFKDGVIYRVSSRS
ncbi:hypothetical protein ACFL2T_00040 [Elusimicrobiota bacterium]